MAAITRDVAQALTQDPETRRAGLVVRTWMGAVELQGSVPSEGAATMATTLASGVAGVRGVQNRATVRLAPAMKV
jgi:osmotically-inducible protein OsmY